MKRLIKAENGNYIDKIRREVMEKSDNDTNMIKLQELDAADVKNDFCINCGDKTLVKKDGFKICELCGTVYKIMDGKVYVVNE